MNLWFRLTALSIAAALASVLTGAAHGATLCVDTSSSGCFAALQPAIDAAHDGDTIAVGAGTFAGGLTIGKSVQIVGAGSSATIIRGGGPVITIGDRSGRTTPTVAISRVTITGGLSRTNPGGGESFATGGGVQILGPSVGNATGATVSITDSVVSGNRASPLSVERNGVLCYPLQSCALAVGGGIDNAGDLTLTGTRITDNVAGSTPTEQSVATSAGGGGIENLPGATLTLAQTVVSGNAASVTSADGTQAGGGGIGDDGVLTIANSQISGNTSGLSTALPGSIFDDSEAEAEAAGINISDGGRATIANSTVSGNTTNALNVGGDVNADTGGIDSDGILTLSNSDVERNAARADVPPGSGFGALALGGGLEIEDGSTTLNTTSVDGNEISATSTTGLVVVNGAGLMNENRGHLTLHNSRVVDNTGAAVGLFGFANGGGIANLAAVPLVAPPAQLTLINSTLTGNTLSASPGIEPLGGGLFTADVLSLESLPVTSIHTEIDGNGPDQCFGC
jgi:hypothetical protein